MKDDCVNVYKVKLIKLMNTLKCIRSYLLNYNTWWLVYGGRIYSPKNFEHDASLLAHACKRKLAIIYSSYGND